MPTIYWFPTPIAGRLGTMAHPRGGAALAGEMTALRQQGVDILISLLGAPEQAELGLHDEAQQAKAAGLIFWALPIFDFTTPPLDSTTAAFVAQIVDALVAGQSVVAHCWMGIGRSSTIAASALCVLGLSPQQAFARIGAARGRPVPDTAEQRIWVEHFAAAWPQIRPTE